MTDPSGPRPWWDRALDVLRTEDAAFRFLVRFALVVAVLTAIVLAVR